MSVDSFINDLVPNLNSIADDFLGNDDRDSLLDLDTRVSSIRNSMANEYLSAPNKLTAVAAQQAYDAVSAIDRQRSIISQTRDNYFEQGQVQRQQTASRYTDLADSTRKLKNQIPSVQSPQDTPDEPYLDDDNNLVFDDGT